MSAVGAPWPVEIKLSRKANRLEIEFDDGLRASLEATNLRRASPSAADHGHAPKAARREVEIDEGVRVTQLRPVGRYAVQIVFSDGHDTGFYTWPLLYRLGQEAAAPGGSTAQG